MAMICEQAVNGRPLTAVAWVQSQVNLCEISNGERTLGKVFFKYISPANYNSTRISIPLIHNPAWYNETFVA
jgi:hypothetical protein